MDVTLFLFCRTNMEDLRYESSAQYLSFISEKVDNQLINASSTALNTSLSNSTTSSPLINDTVFEDSVSQIPPKEWYIIIYSIFIGAAIILTPLSRNVCYIIYMRASKSLHNKMFSNILQAPMRFFDTNPSGKYKKRLVGTFTQRTFET